MEDNLHKKARLHLFRGLFILIALFAMSGRIVSQIYVGNFEVPIPDEGTAYYTYSESGGVSTPAAGTSGSYNVAVSVHLERFARPHAQGRHCDSKFSK
jgi:hypothetical protein